MHRIRHQQDTLDARLFQNICGKIGIFLGVVGFSFDPFDWGSKVFLQRATSATVTACGSAHFVAQNHRLPTPASRLHAAAWPHNATAPTRCSPGCRARHTPAHLAARRPAARTTIACAPWPEAEASGTVSCSSGYISNRAPASVHKTIKAAANPIALIAFLIRGRRRCTTQPTAIIKNKLVGGSKNRMRNLRDDKINLHCHTLRLARAGA